jgi:sirohydrochlorin cobaltochelatase
MNSPVNDLPSAACPSTIYPDAWLVVGHGTRDATGQTEFLQLIALLAERVDVPLQGAFLELAAPSIAEGLKCLADQGAKRVLVVPLLLFQAGHANDDIPEAIAAAAQPLGIEIVRQSPPLGLEPHLLALSRERYREVAPDDSSQEETMLLLVGRGSSDPQAIASVRRYASMLASILRDEGAMLREATAFVAAARPLLPQILEEFAKTRPQQLVVLPHLLFRGEVLATIEEQVTAAFRAHPNLVWTLARHLGPDPLVVNAILARAGNVQPAAGAGRPAGPFQG